MEMQLFCPLESGDRMYVVSPIWNISMFMPAFWLDVSSPFQMKYRLAGWDSNSSVQSQLPFWALPLLSVPFHSDFQLMRLLFSLSRPVSRLARDRLSSSLVAVAAGLPAASVSVG